MVLVEYLRSFAGFVSGHVVSFFIFSKIYSIIRAGRWRKILSSSLDYHRFHLEMILNDPSVDVKNKELAQAMVWAITRQMPEDLKNRGGGAALFRSLSGEKTALNTCGTVFYDIAGNFKFIDKRIVKLNSALTATFYRIFFVESFCSGIAAGNHIASVSLLHKAFRQFLKKDFPPSDMRIIIFEDKTDAKL